MVRDTMDTQYPLEDGDVPLVQSGDTVAPGDRIATRSGAPMIVAYAATLRLSLDTAREGMKESDGTVCAEGDLLGSRRAGLTTRSVLAPASGAVRCLPQSGALVIKREHATSEHQARYAGIVRAVSDRAIVVESEVARFAYAFANHVRDSGALAVVPAHLEFFTTGWLPQTAASTVVAHIADVASLSSIVRSFHGTLFVGSVTESVAWMLLERSHAVSRHTMAAGIVVLHGVGDLAQGKQAVAPFRQFDGAHTMLNRFTQTGIVIPPKTP